LGAQGCLYVHICNYKDKGLHDPCVAVMTCSAFVTCVHPSTGRGLSSEALGPTTATFQNRSDGAGDHLPLAEPLRWRGLSPVFLSFPGHNVPCSCEGLPLCEQDSWTPVTCSLMLLCLCGSQGILSRPGQHPTAGAQESVSAIFTLGWLPTPKRSESSLKLELQTRLTFCVTQ
jgi:hypothetical protein